MSLSIEHNILIVISQAIYFAAKVWIKILKYAYRFLKFKKNKYFWLKLIETYGFFIFFERSLT